MVHKVEVLPGRVGAVSDEDSLGICKRGQGADCCCYLTFGARADGFGFGCAKFSTLRPTIDGRRLQMTAQRQGACVGQYTPDA